MQNKIAKAKTAAAGMALGIMNAMYMAPVYATNSGNKTIESVSVSSDADADKLIGSALGLVLMFAQWIGGFLIVYGAFMLFLAMKNEEPESKSKAIMTMGCGIGLFALKTILVQAGIISAATA